MTIDQFGKTLVASGLMTAEDVKAFWGALPAEGRPKDGAAFAKLLVENSLLTPFQAAEILAGRGARLVMGDYTIVAQIGAGGMGQVYKAQHRRMKRTVALKVMSNAAMQDEAAVKRFQREVHAAARLEHPNIVTAYDSGEAGSVKYLVMQFVDGGDLSDRVKKSGRLPIEQAVGYVIQAAKGLAFAHAAGVVHRDIKPANLLLDKNGVVKILDMGLARIEDGDGLTATEQVMGTVDYMSPEQAAETKNADSRSDIYSLGCTLWHLLTAKKLYDGDTMISRLMKHRDAPLPSLVKERDDATWPLEQVLHKMIAKRPQDRHQSMDEVVVALEPFAPGGSSSSGVTGAGLGGGKGQSAELASFMQAMTGGASKTSASIATPAAKPATSASIDATAAFSAAEIGTDPKSTLHTRGVPPPSGPRKKKPPVKLIAAGILGVALLVIAGIIIKVRNQDGNVIAELNVPSGASAEVSTTTAASAAPSKSAAPTLADTPATPPLSVAAMLESPDYAWSAPENLGPNVNTSYSESKPTLTADELRLVFRCDAGATSGTSSLWECRRASLEEPFGPRVRLTGSAYEDEPFLSADGLTLLYDTHAAPSGRIVEELRQRRRSSLDAPWSGPFSVPMPEDHDEQSPWLSADGLTLIYASPRAGGSGSRDLWICSRASLDAPFGPSTNFRCGANSPASEGSPQLLSDGRTVLFSRDGKPFLTFTSPSGVLSALPLYGVPDDVREPWLSPDGRRLYFHSKRSSGQGDDDLWMMRLLPKGSGMTTPIPQPAKGARQESTSIAQMLDSADYVWTEPENLGPTINGSGNEDRPSLTEDQLQIRFNKAGDSGPYEAVRTSTATPFGTPVLSLPVKFPWLSGDGLTLACVGKAPDGTTDDLHLIHRATRESKWGERTAPGPEVNRPGNFESRPTLSPDGLTLVFNRDSDLWMSRRVSPDKSFGPAAKIGPHVNNNEKNESLGRLLADNQTFVFCRNNEWYFTFTSATGVKSALSARDAPFVGTDVWFAGDGKSVYFAAELPGGFGQRDIWVTRRVPKGSAALMQAPGKPGTDVTDVVYLDDLQEVEAIVGYKSLGKHGKFIDRDGTPANLIWHGAPAEHALWMHPAAREVSFARYRIDGRYSTFAADVGMSDSIPNDAQSNVTFRVLGDGRELWKSSPLRKKGESVPVSLDVRGVKELRLETTCSGPMNGNCHATWFLPRLTPAATDLAQIERLTSPDFVWSEPETLGPVVNAARKTSVPTLTDDQLRIVVGRYGKQGDATNGLHELRRATLDAPWEAVAQLRESNGGYASLSADGLTLVYGFTAGSNDNNIAVRTRSTRDAPWSDPKPIGSLNTENLEYRPVNSPDGLSLVICSDRPGGIGKGDLWISRRTDTQADWQPPVHLGDKINTDDFEAASQILADNRSILFHRDKEGLLLLATPNAQGAYAVRPVPLPPNLKIKKCWLSPDGATLYFDYKRDSDDADNSVNLIRRVPIAAEAAAPVPAIPAEALTFNGHRYLLVDSPGTWDEAKAKAEAMGGHLATLTTQEERDWTLKNVFEKRAVAYLSNGVDARIFLGAERPAVDKPWSWVTGEHFDLSLWLGNGPDGGGNRHVLTWHTNHSWDDVTEEKRYRYLLVEWDTLGPAIGTSQEAAPPLAVAPFDAAQAKAHQAAWAKHLGVTVEFTNSLGMKFVLIPPGEFAMGFDPALKAELERLQAFEGVAEGDKYHHLDAATPRHLVRIPQPYYIGVDEVRVGWYRDVMGSLPANNPADQPDMSVTRNVRYDDAVEFCNRLSEREKRTPSVIVAGDTMRLSPGAGGYRLPTEAEWEFACRAGTDTFYFFGNDRGEKRQNKFLVLAQYQRTRSGSQTLPNPFGLYDVYGGSSEWCWGQISADGTRPRCPSPYGVTSTMTIDIPAAIDQGKRAVVRGGSGTESSGFDPRTVNSYARVTLDR